MISMDDMDDMDDFKRLIEQSSFGTPEAKALRMVTPPSVVRAILRRADNNARLWRKIRRKRLVGHDQKRPFRDLDRFMRGADHYDRYGRAIGLGRWARYSKNPSYNAIRQTLIQGSVTPNGRRFDVHISTIWLGIDLGFGMSTRPVQFETMTFGIDDHEYQWRYTSLTAAKRGHRKLVAKFVHLFDNPTVIDPYRPWTQWVKPRNVAGRLIPKSKLRRPHR